MKIGGIGLTVNRGKLDNNLMDAALKVPVNKFLRIRMASMHPYRPITFDIYILLHQKYVLYMRAGSKFEGDKLENFLNRKADVFYIRDEDRDAYKKYIKERVNDEGLKAEEKALILKEHSFS